MNGQIINLSIQGAKNLMSASFSDSLAAEINSVSRTEARLKTILITMLNLHLYSPYFLTEIFLCVCS